MPAKTRDCCESDACEEARPPVRRRSSRGPLLEDAIPCSEYYPVSIDFERRSMSFVRIPRSTYKNSAFLVPRHTDMGRSLYSFNLDDLLLRNMSSPLQGARTHYILISAFCCSTLLARFLDEMANCLVLKEPALVAQLGMLRYRKSAMAAGEWESEWRQLAPVCLGLMNRAFQPEDIVIVKPSDIGNCIGDAILQHDPRSKAILLSVKLRTFILSVLKSDSRREWTRGRARFWKGAVDAFSPLAHAEVRQLDDARLAAYIWLMTNAFWRELRCGAAHSRVLELDGEEVSDQPGPTLERVMTFFDIPFTPQDVVRIVNSAATSKHSKHPDKQYDAATRRADLQDWERRFGDQADAAIEWASPIADELGLNDVTGPLAKEASSLAAGAI